MWTGFRWVNCIGLTPDVVAAGNVVTLRISAGFLGKDRFGGEFSWLNFNPDSVYLHFVSSAGGDLTNEEPDAPPQTKARAITILRDEKTGDRAMRLIADDPANMTLVQTLEVKVEIGKDVPEGLCSIDITYGRVGQPYRMEEVLNIIRVVWEDGSDADVEVAEFDDAEQTPSGLHVHLYQVNCPPFPWTGD